MRVAAPSVLLFAPCIFRKSVKSHSDQLFRSVLRKDTSRAAHPWWSSPQAKGRHGLHLSSKFKLFHDADLKGQRSYVVTLPREHFTQTKYPFIWECNCVFAVSSKEN